MKGKLPADTRGGSLRLASPLLGAVALAALAGQAAAQDWHERHEEYREHRDFHERHMFYGRDVHRFEPVELGIWRAGQWRNTCFGARCGWWWFAGGQWYWYERPVYPYPLMVSEFAYAEPVAVMPPAVVASPGVVAVPPPAAVAPAPVMVAPAPAPVAPASAAQTLFYCDNPPGYYPAVPSCGTGFRPVPAPR